MIKYKIILVFIEMEVYHLVKLMSKGKNRDYEGNLRNLSASWRGHFIQL